MGNKFKYVFFVGLIVLGIFYFYNKYRVAPSVNLTKLSLVDLNGNRFDWESVKGKKLVVSFGASWCGNCIEELATINSIKLEKLADVEVIVISDEPMEKVQRFAGKNYPFTYLKLNQPFPSIGINSIPVTYIVNTKLEITDETVGYIDWKNEATLQHLKKIME